MLGRSKVVAIVACAVIALSGSACNRGKGVKLGEKHEVGDKASFYLEAADQTNNGKTVKVPEVYFKGTKGYVAIHRDSNGAPGPVIGVSDLINEGDTEDVHIKLTTRLTKSTDVWPMLHLEDNNDGKYDFPPNDAAAKVGNKVITIKVHIKVR